MRYRALLVAAVCFAAAAGMRAAGLLSRGRPEPPRLSELPSTPFALQDAALASAGLRAAAADLAWVQLLQYAAGSLPELEDAPDKPYQHLKTLTQRVVRLDPSFHRAYLFGAGILAWFQAIDRPHEAVELLEEGLRRDPGQPLYSLYIAAIAFKRQGDVGRMLSLLESSFDDPRTPSQMKTILANTYKARGEHRKALELWIRILESPRDASEHPRARQQIPELRRKLRGAARAQ